MAVVCVHRGSVAQVYEVGTQYIESGATLTLGSPTNVYMASSVFGNPGVYVLFKLEVGDSQLVGGTSTVSRIDVTAVPAARTVFQVVSGQDAYWDAATNTIRVKLI